LYRTETETKLRTEAKLKEDPGSESSERRKQSEWLPKNRLGDERLVPIAAFVNSITWKARGTRDQRIRQI
jgi:hypothetical protein